MKKFTLQDYQNNKIHVYKYEPEGEALAVVQIIHGLVLMGSLQVSKTLISLMHRLLIQGLIQ